MNKERMICGESFQDRLSNNTLVLLVSEDKSSRRVGIICGFDCVQRKYVVAYDDTYTTVSEDSDRIKPLPFSKHGCLDDLNVIVDTSSQFFCLCDVSIARIDGKNGEVDMCYVYRGNTLLGTATNLTQLTCAIFGSVSGDIELQLLKRFTDRMGYLNQPKNSRERKEMTYKAYFSMGDKFRIANVENFDEDVYEIHQIKYCVSDVYHLLYSSDGKYEDVEYRLMRDVRHGEDTSLPFFFTIKEDMLLSALDDDSIICEKGVSYIIYEITNNK